MSEFSKVFLVTGGTGLIGKAIAMRLSEDHDNKVVIVGRDRKKIQWVLEDIREKTENPNVRGEQANVAEEGDIKKLAFNWNGPLHCLINNAAQGPRNRLLNTKGIELQFATNVLGYFWMTHYFSRHLKRSKPARVINISSYYAGDLSMNDLEFKERAYDNKTAYRQSKQANRMLTRVFAENFKSFGISVNACHPGDVRSKLSDELSLGGHMSPKEASITPCFLAIDEIGQSNTGKYFVEKKERPCEFAKLDMEAFALYDICMAYTELGQ